MIETMAPGKVILWGEYAVLLGAPALVMAVDRYAICHLNPEGRAWGFSAAGFAGADHTLTRAQLLAAEPPEPGDVSYVPWHVLHGLETADLPPGGRMHIDSRSFYQGSSKLGLGSSAAVSVAVYAAFCRLLNTDPDFRTALHIHHNLQGKLGSGIDIAAAFFGGLLRFQREGATVNAGHPPYEPEHWQLPSDLRMRFIWAGHPASTSDHVRRFQSWLARGDTRAVDALADCSRELFTSADLHASLVAYIDALKRLDDNAALGIYDASHKHLDHLAKDSGVIYKPCGAGGGDIGVAFGTDIEAIDGFVARAEAAGFAAVDLETASHGIQITG
ncbi:MAG: hypothetical protein R3E86_22440 [Pseudomonadales bacterium]